MAKPSLADGEFAYADIGGDYDIGVVYYGEVGIFGVFFYVHTIGALFGGGDETLQVGGLIFDTALFGVVTVHHIANYLGLGGGGVLIACGHHFDSIDKQARS